MDISEFEALMEQTPCCNHKTILGAIKAQNPSNEELINHMAFVMVDDIFKGDRIFFLPLVAALYKKLKE